MFVYGIGKHILTQITYGWGDLLFYLLFLFNFCIIIIIIIIIYN